MYSSRILAVAAGVLTGLIQLLQPAVSLAQNATADSERGAQLIAQTVCSHCHAPAGKGGDPAIPIIDGQQQPYLEVQLRMFRAQRLRDPDAGHYMPAISTTWLMSDQMLTDVANYYASRTAPSGTGADPRNAAGRRLYETGGLAPDFPACGVCHGANAKGLSVFPRLAGQHPEYLTKLMKMQRVGLYEHGSHTAALAPLNDAQIDALAQYLGGM